MTFWCGVELCDGFILERVAVITCRHLGRNVCSRGSKCTRFLLQFFFLDRDSRNVVCRESPFEGKADVSAFKDERDKDDENG